MADTEMKNTTPRPVTNPDAGSNRLFTLVIVGILVLGLGAVAYVVTSREGTNFDGPQTAEVEIDGDVLSALADSGISVDPSADITIGTPLPSISGTGFSNNPVTIEDDGRAKVVYFLAHWCPHCQAELPRIVELMEDGKQPANLDIYAISTSVDATRGGAYPPANWFNREDFTGIVLRDSATSDAFAHYGGSGFPYTIYVDADNNIVARSSGELQSDAIEAMWLLAAGQG